MFSCTGFPVSSPVSDFDGSLLDTIRSLFQSAIAAHGAEEDIAAVVTSFGIDRI